MLSIIAGLFPFSAILAWQRRSKRSFHCAANRGPSFARTKRNRSTTPISARGATVRKSADREMRGEPGGTA